MSFSLQDSFLQLIFHSDYGTWSLSGQQRMGAELENADMSVCYRRERRDYHISSRELPLKSVETECLPSQHGNLRQITITAGPDANAVYYTFTFALPEGYPILLWKIGRENPGNSPIVEFNRTAE